jgi:hypothetical protein
MLGQHLCNVSVEFEVIGQAQLFFGPDIASCNQLTIGLSADHLCVPLADVA